MRSRPWNRWTKRFAELFLLCKALIEWLHKRFYGLDKRKRTHENTEKNKIFPLRAPGRSDEDIYFVFFPYISMRANSGGPMRRLSVGVSAVSLIESLYCYWYK